MHHAVLLVCCLLLYFSDVLSRSINIDFSHRYEFAVDDEEEQESVDLKELTKRIRIEIENNIKQYKEQLKVVNFKIPANETVLKHRKRTKRKPRIPDFLGLAISATTESTNRFVDTPLPPLHARVYPRPKRGVKPAPTSAYFEAYKEKNKVSRLQNVQNTIRSIRAIALKNALIYGAIGLAVLAVFFFLCFCCVTDPKHCCVAFFTCPCCLIMCPCIIGCVRQYFDPKTVLRHNTYAYMPGIRVKKNGKILRYPPSPEEIEAVRDIIDIVKKMKE